MTSRKRVHDAAERLMKYRQSFFLFVNRQYNIDYHRQRFGVQRSAVGVPRSAAFNVHANVSRRPARSVTPGAQPNSFRAREISAKTSMTSTGRIWPLA